MSIHQGEDWLDYGRELGEAIGRSTRPVCFLVGAGCSLSAGAPTTTKIDSELRRATRTRFKGLDLRDAIHQLPEPEKQDILRPLFSGVTTNPGYMALAALAASRQVLVINLNWDLALKTACDRQRIPVQLVDLDIEEPNAWPIQNSTGLIDVHVHGIIGQSCRYGRLETLKFKEDQEKWLRENGLNQTLVAMGASLTFETDLSTLFMAMGQGDQRPQSSRWFFIRSDGDDVTDKLRRQNFGAQALTYVVGRDIDFDKLATVIADASLGSHS